MKTSKQEIADEIYTLIGTMPEEIWKSISRKLNHSELLLLRKAFPESMATHVKMLVDSIPYLDTSNRNTNSISRQNKQDRVLELP